MFNNRVAKISIARLTLQETGTYNQMVNRPYQTYMDNFTLQSLLTRIDGAGSVNPDTIAGFGTQFMKPTAHAVSNIGIPQGWGERRIRFSLEVHIQLNTGSQQVHFFQGYTNYLGISTTGAIDDRMIFFINSYTVVVRSTQLTPVGAVTQDFVTESAHIINGNIINDQQQGYSPAFSMRPDDMFYGIQSAHMTTAMNAYDTPVIDTRVRINNEPICSKRVNNIPNAFVADIVDRYKHSCYLTQFGQDDADILSRSRDYKVEQSPISNQFIFALSQVKNIPAATFFTISDLIKIDNNASKVINFLTLGTTVSQQTHSTGQSEYWETVSNESVAATLLSNAVPAIMMDLLITKISFIATNRNFGGMQVAITQALSPTNADMSRNYEMFKRRLEHELLFDLTYQNQEILDLAMTVDLYGESRIEIGFGANPKTLFVTPSFCDSLISPVICMDRNIYNQNVHDYEVLLNAVNNNVNGDLAPALNHNL